MEGEWLFGGCAGNLVASRFVLTAGHCVTFSPPKKPSDFMVCLNPESLQICVSLYACYIATLSPHPYVKLVVILLFYFTKNLYTRQILCVDTLYNPRLDYC